MKKFIIGLFVLVFAVALNSCSDSTTNPVTPVAKGSLVIKSTPSGAQIWKDGTSTGRVTPDTLTSLDAGTVSITLKLTGFTDIVFSAIVVSDSTTEYNKEFPASTQTFLTSIKLYETVGTTAAQPSGLILSSGTASGIGSSATDRAKVDVFYNSTGYVVASANGASGLTRITHFKLASSSTLTDGVASPVKDATWVKSVKDTETNYFFAVDNDNHYSKIKIFNRGGGVPGTPAWIEVQYIYNKVAGDTRF
ncbi:MAG: PEGA domain-containing protein [Ignavibacteria bacterium]